MFMCKPHWASLPPKYQRAIWREYKPGQERSKDPSLRYLAVQQMAIGVQAFRPNDESATEITANYIFRAMIFAAKAIEAGEGNPLDGLLSKSAEIPSSAALEALAVTTSKLGTS